MPRISAPSNKRSLEKAPLKKALPRLSVKIGRLFEFFIIFI